MGAFLVLISSRLKKCLLENGISGILVKDCEQIMISEFSDIEGQVKVLCEERSNLLGTLRQLETLGAAVKTYWRDQCSWKSLMKRGMKLISSRDITVELYENLIKSFFIYKIKIERVCPDLPQAADFCWEPR